MRCIFKKQELGPNECFRSAADIPKVLYVHDAHSHMNAQHLLSTRANTPIRQSGNRAVEAE